MNNLIMLIFMTLLTSDMTLHLQYVLLGLGSFIAITQVMTMIMLRHQMKLKGDK